MTKEQMIDRLRDVVDARYSGNVSSWGRAHGVGRAQATLILQGKRGPKDSMLAEVGMRRTVRYVRSREVVYEEALPS